jgi:hypothetical protein
VAVVGEWFGPPPPRLVATRVVVQLLSP